MRATYRLQPGPGFGFAGLRDLALVDPGAPARVRDPAGALPVALLGRTV